VDQQNDFVMTHIDSFWENAAHCVCSGAARQSIGF
jgi:hypothetical protein